MAKDSKIEWTDHTFNPWWGCSKVSPGCDHCYAEALAKRYGHDVWGPGKRRRFFGPKHWDEPYRWNVAAAEAGTRARVFCGSMCDVFDNEVSPAERMHLWALIEDTPHLDWLLLTKRIGIAADMVPPRWQAEGWPPNVWAGASFVNQPEVDRDMSKLLALRARIRFGSFEPLLGPVDLARVEIIKDGPNRCGTRLNVLTGQFYESRIIDQQMRLSWVIVGGESGPKARPMHPDWARSLRDQCVAAGGPFFFKQWGEWAPHKPRAGGDLGGDVRADRVRLVHPSGRSDVDVFQATGGHNTEPGSRYMIRLGKKAAGRRLDGREWSEFPLSPA